MQENINIPDSTITTNLSFRQLVLMNMQQLTNFPYIEKDFDALTDYELLSLVVKYLNDVIANQNEQNDSITRMYQSFLALQDYVNNTKDTLEDAFNNLDDYVRNYFANLDVQDEINNKLDQMLEDGVLEQIIEQFLQLTSLLCYDNVASMKASPNLTNGSFARTLGYYGKNDGGASLYKIRTITNDDVVNEMNIIEMLNDNTLIAELITYEDVSIKQLGAKGDDVNDDSEYLRFALNNYDNVKLDTGTYKITSNILVSNIVNLNGNNKATLHFTAGTENLSPNTNGKLNMYNVKIKSDAGTCYHINRTGIKDTHVENNNIESISYGILVNQNTDDGQDIYINKNKIDTHSDGIEINTTSDNSNKFKNTIITDNIISITGGSGTSSGFGIGVADGKNVVISNNIIDESRLEGIHIEDTSKEIAISNNVLSNCHSDGIRVYGVTGNVERCTITSNNIKGDKTTGKAGIYLPTVTTGVINLIDLNSNNINNFDYGIFSYRNINADNTIIENCNTAFNSETKRVQGHIQLIDTPVIINSSNEDITEIDNVELFKTTLTGLDSGIDIDNFIKSTSTNKIMKFHKLKYRVVLPITATTDSRVIKFMKKPTYMDAVISCDITTGFAYKGRGVTHVTYDETNGLVNTKITHVNSGVFSEPNKVILTDDNYLAVQPYNPNQASGFMYLDITIDGDIIMKGTY